MACLAQAALSELLWPSRSAATSVSTDSTTDGDQSSFFLVSVLIKSILFFTQPSIKRQRFTLNDLHHYHRHIRSGLVCIVDDLLFRFAKNTLVHHRARARIPSRYHQAADRERPGGKI